MVYQITTDTDMSPYAIRPLLAAICCVATPTTPGASAQRPIAHDIDMAMEICNSRPLDNMEGVWTYPEDNVTVLILKGEDSWNNLPRYDISVVSSDDCKILPGDIIGHIEATPSADSYTLSLFTENDNGIPKKPESCLASLSKDSDALIIKQSKSRSLKFRLNINLSRLLPNFWRIVRMSVSPKGNDPTHPPRGMVKIFPSYDGNGSSRREPRYL